MGSTYHQVTLKALSCSMYNWIMTPKNNNTENMRSRFMKSVMEEVAHHQHNRVLLLREHADLYNTRQELLALIY